MKTQPFAPSGKRAAVRIVGTDTRGRIFGLHAPMSEQLLSVAAVGILSAVLVTLYAIAWYAILSAAISGLAGIHPY